MKIVQVIEALAWKNKVTGATASVHGACPWTSDADRINWVRVAVGFTWLCANGTVGLGRIPAKTFEEAEAIMFAVNARHTLGAS